jgi:hypothetical protein
VAVQQIRQVLSAHAQPFSRFPDGRPIGSMQSLRTISPGCGGLFIGMIQRCGLPEDSVIIQVIHVGCMAGLKPKGNARVV